MHNIDFHVLVRIGREPFSWCVINLLLECLSCCLVLFRKDASLGGRLCFIDHGHCHSRTAQIPLVVLIRSILHLNVRIVGWMLLDRKQEKEVLIAINNLINEIIHSLLQRTFMSFILCSQALCCGKGALARNVWKSM